MDISKVLQYFVILNFNKIFFGANLCLLVQFFIPISTLELIHLLFSSDTSVKFSSRICIKLHVLSLPFLYGYLCPYMKEAVVKMLVFLLASNIK